MKIGDVVETFSHVCKIVSMTSTRIDCLVLGSKEPIPKWDSKVGKIETFKRLANGEYASEEMDFLKPLDRGNLVVVVDSNEDILCLADDVGDEYVPVCGHWPAKEAWPNSAFIINLISYPTEA